MMRSGLKLALRGILIMAGATLLAIVLGPPSPSRSPYLSALSPLAGQPAYADKSCNGHACIGGGHHHLNCAPLPGWKCTNLSHSCTAQTCT